MRRQDLVSEDCCPAVSCQEHCWKERLCNAGPGEWPAGGLYWAQRLPSTDRVSCTTAVAVAVAAVVAAAVAVVAAAVAVVAAAAAAAAAATAAVADAAGALARSYVGPLCWQKPIYAAPRASSPASASVSVFQRSENFVNCLRLKKPLGQAVRLSMAGPFVLHHEGQEHSRCQARERRCRLSLFQKLLFASCLWVRQWSPAPAQLGRCRQQGSLAARSGGGESGTA